LGATHKSSYFKDPVMDKPGHYPPLLYFSIFLSAVGGFLFGYDTGVIAGAMPLIEKDRDFWPTDKDEQTLWLSVITAITVGFAFLFSLIGGWITDRFGRKPAILVASTVFAAGSIVMAVTPNKEVLLVGRIVVGMGIGIASMCVPVYMAETSPVDMRGLLGASFQVMICFGQVVAAVVDALFEPVKNGWKYDFGLAAIPSAILMVGFFFCPESPRWLVQRGRNEEAKDVLRRMRRTGEPIETELEEIVETVRQDEKAKELAGGSPFRRGLADPGVRKAMLVGCSLQLFQQLIGINTVIYYSARILMMSGISNDMAMILWLSAAVTGVNFLASFIGMSLIDRVGRRILTLSSYASILLSLLLIGTGFLVNENHSTPVTYNENISSLGGNNSCRVFNDCYSCVDEADELDCGFCFEEDDASTNGQGKGSCVPWSIPDGEDEPQANFGRCSNKDNTTDVTFVAQYCKTDYSFIILIGLICYLVSFQSGVGPIPWVYNPEIYPLWFRSTGVSISTGFNWCLNLIVTFTFPFLQEALGFGAYYLFAGFAVLAIIWFFLVLAESKGKTLEEMNQVFSRPLLKLGASQ